MNCGPKQKTCVSSAETLHLFGPWGNPATDLPPAPTQRIKTLWQQSVDTPRPWLVRTSGRGRQRYDAGATLDPLNTAQLNTNEGSYSLRPLSKIQIEARTANVGGMDHQPIIMNAGGSCIVYGNTVAVSVLTPPAMREVVPGVALDPVPARDVAVDELISGEVLELRHTGQTSWIFSEDVTTVDGQRTSFPIPANARDVTITPRTAGAPGVWAWAIGDFQALGVNYQLGTFTPTTRPIAVPSATHIDAAAAAGPATYNLAWAIQA
jgi:hypothetical protein